MRTTLSWTQARRIALRAQGMGRARRTELPSAATSRRSLRSTLERTHLLQIDSVNIFERAHHLPVFTRTGSWDPAALERASRPGPTRLVRETLAHEATYATDQVHSLLEFRRRSAATRDWSEIREAAASSPQLFARILAAFEELGPVSASAVSRHLGDTERGEGWGWRRTASQWAIEYLFRSGTLEGVGRNSQFERLYAPVDDAAGRILRLDPAAAGAATPAAAGEPSAPREEIVPEEDGATDAAAIIELMGLAARSLGIAEPASLADYFRLPLREVRPAIAQLLAAGELSEVLVNHPGGQRQMLLHRDAPAPAALKGAALVSPFDPIVFHRPRLEQLFDVEYRIGIYTPAHKRTSGYYSLLFLLGDVFPARVDLKADRTRGVLEVRGVFREELAHLPARQRPSDDAVAAALGEEIRRAAIWQRLDRVEVDVTTGTRVLADALAGRVEQEQEHAAP